MRIWDYRLLPYLPDAQLRSQWRECALIAYGLQKNGTHNHLLVNRVTEYSYDEFATYCCMVKHEMQHRNFQVKSSAEEKIFIQPWKYIKNNLFSTWHNKKYLRVCMANLYEKHIFGIGKSRITDEEWARLCEGYEKITGEVYQI